MRPIESKSLGLRHLAGAGGRVTVEVFFAEYESVKHESHGAS